MRKPDATDMSVWTPITPRSGRGLVHITSLTDAHRAACGKISAGWKVATGAITCQECKAVVHYDTRPKRRRRR